MKKPTFISSANLVKVLVIAAAVVSVSAFGYVNSVKIERVEATTVNDEVIMNAPDPEKARAAFKDAVKVFFSARCANCHPGGEIPMQNVHGTSVSGGSFPAEIWRLLMERTIGLRPVR